jgi:vitamin B12 transporter
MLLRTVHRLFSGHFLSRSARAAMLFCALSVAAHAASIRGVVTDASGARITGATVQLISSGQVVGSAVSGADGSFQIMTGQRGRFVLVV